MKEMECHICSQQVHVKNMYVEGWGWGDGSVVKSTDCFHLRLKFNSQHPRGSSQLSVTPVPGLLIPIHRHACWQNTSAHKIKVNRQVDRSVSISS
ncbi:putative RNA methylase MDS024, isoform CRA_b [Rattus norvegicus]|uniref:Putative RNA methylase MDS024, isoform CRA_b n=1 Tax=Rattus norvegicus TaxID=10116 RepID=A6JUS7_RAT|nr:putative RNA methylase MDS024, isoform CRA_b [Rattus norvegicus]